MAVEQSVEGLMKEIGPLVDLAFVGAYEGERIWQLAVDEDTIIFAELDVPSGKLMLSADIGMPPEKERARFYELLLRYASAWQATGGARVVMSDGDQSLWLLLDCHAIGLTLHDFAESLGHFVVAVRAWRESIQAYEDNAETAPRHPDLIQGSALA